MPPTEPSYREMQKMNENLRRENHLLRLLDDLYRENSGLKGESSFCSGSGSGSQEKGDEKETEVEVQATKELSQESSWNESDNTLCGDRDDGKDRVNGTAGSEALSERIDEKGGGEEAQDNDMKTSEDSKISENQDNQPEEKEDKNEKEHSEYDDTNASGSESDPTWRCACNDEDGFYETSDVEESESESETDSESEEDYDVDQTIKYSERNRVLSKYKERKLGLSGFCPTALGESKLDAGLYMASGLELERRTDVSVYTSLYGLHPAIVSWIGESLPIHCIRFCVRSPLITSYTPDYEPTISLLDKHAEIVLSREDCATDFFNQFQNFIKVLEESDFPSGYFEEDDVHGTERHGTGRCKTVADAHMACVATLYSF